MMTAFMNVKEAVPQVETTAVGGLGFKEYSPVTTHDFPQFVRKYILRINSSVLTYSARLTTRKALAGLTTNRTLPSGNIYTFGTNVRRKLNQSITVFHSPVAVDRPVSIAILSNQFSI